MVDVTTASAIQAYDTPGQPVCLEIEQIGHNDANLVFLVFSPMLPLFEEHGARDGE